jgi:DNA-binding NarL/FixJ family response regulator
MSNGRTDDDVPDRRVRVMIVDDSHVVRFSVRALLETDDRFEVVAEGTNGQEAIDLAAELQPDLVLLDRQMPVMGGMEAIPGIRQTAPHTAVVLYTAFVDGPTAQAALAAGAADILEKGTSSSDLVDDLATILLSQWADPDATDVRVGPLDSNAASVWIDNTTTIIEALRAHPEVVDVPGDVLDLFERFIDAWREIAWANDEFTWAARASASEVRRLVEQWVTVNALSDEQMARLGCHWSPPEGAPFFEALVEAIGSALGRHEETRQLSAVLLRQTALSTRLQEDAPERR